MEFRLDGFSVFDGTPENHADLRPDPRDMFQFLQETKRNTYLVCRYAGFENELIIHAKEASYCAFRRSKETGLLQVACWASS
jgi:hypothetical protein